MTTLGKTLAIALAFGTAAPAIAQQAETETPIVTRAHSGDFPDALLVHGDKAQRILDRENNQHPNRNG